MSCLLILTWDKFYDYLKVFFFYILLPRFEVVQNWHLLRSMCVCVCERVLFCSAQTYCSLIQNISWIILFFNTFIFFLLHYFISMTMTSKHLVVFFSRGKYFFRTSNAESSYNNKAALTKRFLQVNLLRSMDRREIVKVWRFGMVNTQSLGVGQQTARVSPATPVGPHHARRHTRGRGWRWWCRWWARRAARRWHVVEVVGKVELRGRGSHRRVGGRRHGDQHAVDGVVCHVVHLGVDFVSVVTGSKIEKIKN